MRKAIKVILSLVLCCAMFGNTALAAVGTFPDVPEDADYFEAVEMLAELGIVKGDDEGNFNPDSTIIRAEAATMICRLLGVEEEALQITETVFTDVPADYWGVGYITKCVELGIINGHGDGTFGPLDPVTYEQMVKMLVCAWGYEALAKEAGGYPNGYMQIASETGMTTDVVALQDRPLPRSEVAKLVYNTLSIEQYIG